MRFAPPIILSFFALFSARADSPVPFHESFPTSYTEGERLGGATSGVVWNTGNSTGTASPTNTVAAALSYPGLVTSNDSRGILLSDSPSSNRDRGTVFNPVQNINSTAPVLYASFLFNVQTPPSAATPIAYFRNSTSSGNPSAGVFINGLNQLQIVKSGTAPAAPATQALTPGTHLVVLRYKWNAGDDDDEVALWLDPPSLGTAENAVPPPAITTTSGNDVTAMNAFFVSRRTGASGTFWLDEVRFARTWADATPSDGTTPLPHETRPRITGAFIGPDGFILEGTNGTPGGVYRVLASPAIQIPLALWSELATNTFDGNGAFAWTNPLAPANAREFYALLLGGEIPVAPEIVTHPESQAVVEGQNAVFTVVASGTDLSYRWYFNTNTLLPASGSSLTITNSQPTHEGAYFVIVTNSLGSVTSEVATLTVSPPPATGLPAGFATVNGNTTGGAGGPVVTVSTFAEFDSHARVQPGPRIIQVQGTINLGTSNARLTSNKTVIGLGTNATLVGNLKCDGVDNIIIQNITFTNPAEVGDGDGFTLQDTRHVWVDHCTFVDCGDGSLDITHAADWVTVSWCKFYYTFNSGHNFVNLIGHSDNNAGEDAGKLHVTFHHNWWSTLSVERMPRVRFGRVHTYNNYFNAPGNNYCIRVARDSEVFAESNYFENVEDPWELFRTTGADGKLYATNNVEVNTTWSSGNVFPGTDILGPDLNPPPYSYTPDPAASVPNSVTNGAGAGRGPFAL